MTVDFICQRCDGSFELDFGDMLEGEPIECPNCDQKASKKASEELATSLEELMGKVAELRGKFEISLTVESDDLPAKFDEPAAGDEDEEEEEDEDEDDDEDLDEDDDDEDEPPPDDDDDR